MTAVNLAEKLATFREPWQPRTVAEFNGHDIMVVKLHGAFPWHKHDGTDDVFLVLSGRVTIQLRDRDVALGPGELYVVPRGVEHRPVADEEARARGEAPRSSDRRCWEAREARGPLDASLARLYQYPRIARR